MMEEGEPPIDMISNLPSNIICKILTLMPIRYAFRTSILSHNWRDHCVNIPELKFDDGIIKGPVNKTLPINELLQVIYPILLLHQVPIIEFSLCTSLLSHYCEIDQIIIHLSRKATVKKLTLCLGVDSEHKLLPSFFKMEQLVILKLGNCAFQPPPTFKGFRKLVGLSLNYVGITSEVLLDFVFKCPLIKDSTLIGRAKHLKGCQSSDMVKLLKCLPLIERLHMGFYPFKCFANGVSLQKLPSSLVHLKNLHLSGLCFKETAIHSALVLATSCPNLETIAIEMRFNRRENVSQIEMTFLDVQDYSYITFDHLREIKITNFINKKPLMGFVKLILAKSPKLKLANIVVDKRIRLSMLNTILQYQRASPRSEIIFNRP